MKIKLAGCRVEPLGSYLKGLGVFKLVSEQLDPKATMAWEDGILIMEVNADRDRLIDFFVREYQPSPILSPWNSGSGFYNAKKNVLKEIEKTSSWRFSLYRDVIFAIRSFHELKDAKKNVPLTAYSLKMDKEEFKRAVVKRCETLHPMYLQWLDAVMYRDGDDIYFNKLLDSGGNDGQLEYSGTFMKYVVAMMIDRNTSQSAPSLLENSLFGEPTDDMVMDIMGKWYPAVAGGYNMGVGIKRNHFPVNPWDFIFTMEGTLMWSFRARTEDKKLSPVFPFVVNVTPFGYPSASMFDVEKASEIWLPMWDAPMTFDQLKEMFIEKSVPQERPPRSGMEFVTSVFSGSEQMEYLRYISSIRRGQASSTMLAGRYESPATDELAALRDIPPIDGLLRRLAQKQGHEIDSMFYALRRDLGNSFFRALENFGGFHDALRVLGRIEILLSSLKSQAVFRPLSGLSPGWIALADDGSVEYRIAASIASIGKTGPVPSIRPYLEPVDDSGRRWLDNAGRSSWSGSSLPGKMLSVLLRRSRDAISAGTRHNPLWSPLELQASDIAYFISGETDDAKIEELLFGMILTSGASEQYRSLPPSNAYSPSPIPLSMSFSRLKTLFLPRPIYLEDRASFVSPGPALLSLLEAGRYSDALRDARRRMAVFGFNLNPVHMDSGNPVRVAGALLLPVRFQGFMTERALT